MSLSPLNRSCACLALTATSFFVAMAPTVQAKEPSDSVLGHKMKTIDGETFNLEEHQGKVVLIVNTASRCGLTGQYQGLQNLYAKYKDQGLVVIGFPCNQFRGQEPGTNADVKAFCSEKYNVTFPMMSKIEVNGKDAAPLYKQLTGQKIAPVGDGPISWNFEKFLINRQGQPANRFSPRTIPESKDLIKAIETELAKG